MNHINVRSELHIKFLRIRQEPSTGNDKSLTELHSFLAETAVNSEQGSERLTVTVVLRCTSVGLRCFNMPAGEIC